MTPSNHQLLEKFVSDELSESEARHLSESLQKKEISAEEFSQFLHTHGLLSSALHPDKSMKRIERLLHRGIGENSHLSDRVMVKIHQHKKESLFVTPLKTYLTAVAALLLLSFSIYIFVYQDIQQDPSGLIQTDGRSLKTIELAGSHITLNSNTQINIEGRQVTLHHGKIFVDSKGSHSLSFQTKYSKIEMLGTLFELASYSQQGRVVDRVIVQKGKVLFSGENNEKELKAGQYALAGEVGKISLGEIRPEILSWPFKENTDIIYHQDNRRPFVSEFWKDWTPSTMRRGPALNKMTFQLSKDSAPEGIRLISRKIDTFHKSIYFKTLFNFIKPQGEITFGFELYSHNKLLRITGGVIKNNPGGFLTKSFSTIDGKTHYGKEIFTKKLRTMDLQGSVNKASAKIENIHLVFFVRGDTQSSATIEIKKSEISRKKITRF